MFDDLRVEPRRNTEFRSRLYRRVDLLATEYRARADEHIGISLRHAAYDLVRTLGAESDLGAVYPAVAQSLCKLFRVFNLVELDNGHNADVAELGNKRVDFIFYRHYKNPHILIYFNIYIIITVKRQVYSKYG